MRVTHSLLHAEDLAQLVEREYAVAAPVTVSLLNRGFNDTYLATDVEGAHRVLRVYNRDKYWIRSESDLRFELDLLEHLAAAGLGVIRPYQRTLGDRLGRLTAPEGERCFALFSHAPGTSLHEGNLTAEQWREFGSAIARMHLEMDAFRTGHDRHHLDERILVQRPLASLGERWAAVLAGYQQIRALSQSEVAAFPVLAACRAMWDTGDWLGATDRTGDAWMTDAVIARLLADVRKAESGPAPAGSP